MASSYLTNAVLTEARAILSGVQLAQGAYAVGADGVQHQTLSAANGEGIVALDIVGAIHRAANGATLAALVTNATMTEAAAVAAAAQVLGTSRRGQPLDQVLVEWGDVPGRTTDEATALLTQAIDAP